MLQEQAEQQECYHAEVEQKMKQICKGGGLEAYGGTFRGDKAKACYGRLALSLTIDDPGRV